MEKCVNMNAWYEKLTKIWIINTKIKFKVTCLPVKSGELWTEAWDIVGLGTVFASANKFWLKAITN